MNAAAPDVVLLGNLLVDDIVLRDGRTLMAEPGGAVLHAALAASLWGARVGICSITGTDYPAAALAALPPDIAYVFIHDCARPLVSPEQLVALHKIVVREHAVVLAHRVTDTIKKHRGDARLRTLERERLWAMETPQVFSRDLLDRAYARVTKKKLRITDDAQAVETLDHPIALLENTSPNPKITTPGDLAYLEFLLARTSESAQLPRNTSGTTA